MSSGVRFKRVSLPRSVVTELRATPRTSSVRYDGFVYSGLRALPDDNCRFVDSNGLTRRSLIRCPIVNVRPYGKEFEGELPLNLSLNAKKETDEYEVEEYKSGNVDHRGRGRRAFSLYGNKTVSFVSYHPGGKNDPQVGDTSLVFEEGDEGLKVFSHEIGDYFLQIEDSTYRSPELSIYRKDGVLAGDKIGISSASDIIKITFKNGNIIKLYVRDLSENERLIPSFRAKIFSGDNFYGELAKRPAINEIHYLYSFWINKDNTTSLREIFKIPYRDVMPADISIFGITIKRFLGYRDNSATSNLLTDARNVAPAYLEFDLDEASKAAAYGVGLYLDMPICIAHRSGFSFWLFATANQIKYEERFNFSSFLYNLFNKAF